MSRLRTKVCACISCPAHPDSCPELTTARHCPACAGEYERRRGTRVQRGYGREHTRLRAQWKPKVERISVHCHAKICVMPARLILPGQAWDLGHTADRTGWTGPEHARCNRADGGRASHGRTA